MTKRAALLSIAFTSLATTAFAQGCPPTDGETIAQVEQLNQMMIDADYAGLTTALQDAGIEGAGLVDPLAANFPSGFDSCTTLVQRNESGTMTQTVVAFPNANSTVFVYWQSGFVGDKFYMLNVYLNTDQGKLLDKVF